MHLFRGAAWSVVGAGASRLVGLIASLATARMLHQEGFGRLAIVLSTVLMFQVFAGAGMGMTATKYVADYRFRDPRAAGGIILLSHAVSAASGLMIGVGIFWGSEALAAEYLGDGRLSSLLRVAALSVPLIGINGAQNGTLAGLQAFGPAARVATISSLIAGAFTIAGVAAFGVEGGVWATVVSSLVQCWITGVAVLEQLRDAGIRSEWAAALEQRRTIWNFAIPAILSGVMVAPVNWWATALLARQPGGMLEVGNLSAASQWLTLIVFLPSRIQAVSMPMLSERFGRRATKETRQVLSVAILLNGVIVVPVAGVVALASPIIMSAYGPTFAPAWLCLSLVAVTAALISIAMPVGDLLAAAGGMWTSLAMNAAWAVLFVVTLHLIARGQPLTATLVALARLLAYACHSVWVAWWAHNNVLSQQQAAGR